MDCFALFEETRRPWLDPEVLKAKFLALSEKIHPDRVHHLSPAKRQAATERYTELNAAYQTLKEPRDRLGMLLELERGDKVARIEQVPSEAMDLFMRIGQLCRDVDGFLRERTAVTSPLLKVQMFERAMEWTDQLNATQQVLRDQQTALEQELKSMNEIWESAPPVGTPERSQGLPLDRLEQIYRSFGYLSKWTAQCRERVVQLSL